MFGYPLVCYSPLEKERAKGEFWQHLYRSTMNNVRGKHNNIISELLNHYDEFQLKQENLLKNLTNGTYLKNMKGTGETKVRNLLN